MLTETAVQILSSFRDETHRNGKFKLKDAYRDLITLFIDFDPVSGTIDRSLYSRLNKLLGQAVKRGSELTGLGILTRISISAMERSSAEIYLTSYDHITSFGRSLFARLGPGKYNDLLFSRATEAELSDIENLRKRLEEIQPIVQKYEAMNERVTRKGKLSKAVQKKFELHLISTSLNPDLKEALMRIKARWQKVMTNNFERYFRAKVDHATEFIGVFSSTPTPARTVDDLNRIYSLQTAGIAIEEKALKGKYRPANASEILAMAVSAAEAEADSFFEKLLFKLSGVLSDKHSFSKATEVWDELTPYESSFLMEFGPDFSFTLHSQIITNFSVYNKPFHQFPTVFRNVKLDGNEHTVMSELQLKVSLRKHSDLKP